MSLATHHPTIPLTLRQSGLEQAIARLRSCYLRWGSARLNRALAVELTDEQLADAGLQRTTLTGGFPAIEIRASVVAELMSMR